MRLNVINTIEDVVDRQLCSGCGACAALEPARFEMVDVIDHGRRPRPLAGARAASGDALGVCPGRGISNDFDRQSPRYIESLVQGWGPIIELYEGWATDPDIRHRGSSGGAATALALALMEHDDAHGTLHIAARPDAPLLNQTVLSTTRDELLAATGSRYAPASPADGLGRIAGAPGACVFIGKPCDVAAAHRARRLRPDLDNKLALSIAIFCAGTPTTRATHRLIERLGVDHPGDVVNIRYRGRGWPGRLAVTVRTKHGLETRHLEYADAWGDLTRDKAWRCQVCVDHTGELADVSVGDPWYRPIEPGEPGRSLIVVRTERGHAAVRRAIECGALHAELRSASILTRSQPNLLRGRGAVWARRFACRLAGVPIPADRGFPAFRFWWSELTLLEKARSFAGTFRRIRRRGLRRPCRMISERPRTLRIAPTPASIPPSPQSALRRAA